MTRCLHDHDSTDHDAVTCLLERRVGDVWLIVLSQSDPRPSRTNIGCVALMISTEDSTMPNFSSRIRFRRSTGIPLGRSAELVRHLGGDALVFLTAPFGESPRMWPTSLEARFAAEVVLERRQGPLAD